MLVGTGYTYDADHVFVDEAGTDVASTEISATNYTGGFNGSGRKTCTITGQANLTNNRGDFAVGDLTWSSIGGASNATIGYIILIKEITNDAGSKLIACFDVTDTSTSGGDIQADFLALGSGGNLRFAA